MAAGAQALDLAQVTHVRVVVRSRCLACSRDRD